jgi:hypothetical protein
LKGGRACAWHHSEAAGRGLGWGAAWSEPLLMNVLARPLVHACCVITPEPHSDEYYRWARVGGRGRGGGDGERGWGWGEGEVLLAVGALVCMLFGVRGRW